MPVPVQIPSFWIYFVFFLSGFSALLYQLIWQRILFSIYGINIESVTVVVTAFMLGLGLGSLMGGFLSKKAKLPILLLFGGIEVAIGVYGFFSLMIFDWVGSWTLGLTPLKTAFITFLLVLFPTLLMGCTLPLLVAHFVLQSGNVGKTVGTLYFVNTLGASVASFVAVFYIFGTIGLLASTYLAASLNGILGASIILLFLFNQGSKALP